MSKARWFFIFQFFLTFSLKISNAAVPNVVATIKPVHGLISAIMVGVNKKPILLVDNAVSLHHYQLKPSDMKVLQKADFIFLIAPELEGFLSPVLDNIVDNNRVVILSKIPGLQLHKVRNYDTGIHMSSYGGNHDHHHHDNMMDLHIWLNPNNAILIAKKIAEILSRFYPDNSKIYKKNLQKLISDIKILDKKISSMLFPLAKKKFAVFHDGYQYFEKHYKINALAVIAENITVGPSTRHLKNIIKILNTNSVTCIFNEAQFSNDFVNIVAKKVKNINIGTLDPVGDNVGEGASHYQDMMLNIAKEFVSCLN